MVNAVQKGSSSKKYKYKYVKITENIAPEITNETESQYNKVGIGLSNIPNCLSVILAHFL